MNTNCMRKLHTIHTVYTVSISLFFFPVFIIVNKCPIMHAFTQWHNAVPLSFLSQSVPPALPVAYTPLLVASASPIIVSWSWTIVFTLTNVY